MSVTSLNSISEIIEDLRSGKMVILVDDENRENEGDLILAADFVTPQAINFMATEARGLICLSLTKEQIHRLNLPLMVGDERNRSPNKTAFTVSIEAASGVSTGISASDRAHTIRVAANPVANPHDVITPGHIFPISAQAGGVLKRAGHTEASVDLARLAGLNPAAVICEIMNDDGTMARVDQLKEFAKKHHIKIGTIEDLIKYRLETESFVEELKVIPLESTWGTDFRAHLFRDQLSGREHLAVVKGQISADDFVYVRVQTENTLGDVFWDAQHPTAEQINSCMGFINRMGRGVIVYLRNEELSKNFGGEHVMDERNYGVGAQILRSLGARKIILLSNHPTKKVGIKGYGLEIIDTISVPTSSGLNSDHQEGAELGI